MSRPHARTGNRKVTQDTYLGRRGWNAASRALGQFLKKSSPLACSDTGFSILLAVAHRIQNYLDVFSGFD